MKRLLLDVSLTDLCISRYLCLGLRSSPMESSLDLGEYCLPYAIHPDEILSMGGHECSRVYTKLSQVYKVEGGSGAC